MNYRMSHLKLYRTN